MSTGWIPVGERLPEWKKPVIAYYGNWKGVTEPYKQVTAQFSKQLGWIDIRRGLMMPGVTHWRELEPPPTS